jgi:menaquinol-cytochrome c reductase iron-sulfur subunit
LREEGRPVADEVEPSGETPEHEDPGAHLPSPTIWPFAFAGAVALILVGLIVSPIASAIGVALAVVFGFLWIRQATREVRGEPEPAEAPEPEVVESEEGPARIERARFLEGATLGLGALIGAVVTLPVLGFTVLPAFVDQGFPDVDLGPLDKYPENEWRIATFFSRPEDGNVSRRTAFVRYNGVKDEVPSFTVISNRCVHLGCPTQPQGPPGEPEEVKTTAAPVTLTPTQPSGFGCPCHGGAYDIEGNRVAGPPVRSLDRYEYSIKDGSLFIGAPYSVGEVTGAGADAVVTRYRWTDPGVHVDGPEEYLYPYSP